MAPRGTLIERCDVPLLLVSSGRLFMDMKSPAADRWKCYALAMFSASNGRLVVHLSVITTVHHRLLLCTQCIRWDAYGGGGAGPAEAWRHLNARALSLDSDVCCHLAAKQWTQRQPQHPRCESIKRARVTRRRWRKLKRLSPPYEWFRLIVNLCSGFGSEPSRNWIIVFRTTFNRFHIIDRLVQSINDLLFIGFSLNAAFVHLL